MFDQLPNKNPHLIKNVLPKELITMLEDLNSFPVKLFEYYTGEPLLGGTIEQITLVCESCFKFII